jgi:hypothetical protein
LTLRVRAKAALRLRDVLRFAGENQALAASAFDAAEQAYALQLVFQEVPQSSGHETHIFAAQPNPTSSGVQIPVQLAQASQVKVELFDLNGKLLYFSNLEFSAGAHLLDIAAEAFPVSGLYTWRVQAGEHQAQGRVVRH